MLIIRVTSDEILAEYLCWALNQAKAQHYLKSQSRGSNMPMLNKQSLGSLAITLPSLAVQKKIVTLQKQWLQQQEIYQTLISNGARLTQGLCQQLLSSN